MSPFIKKHEFNYIKKCLFDLNNSFRNCVDKNVVEASKSYIQDKIYKKFYTLTEEQREILSIDKIIEPLYIEGFINGLNPYVYGMDSISSTQITKVFKKEKKLKLPTMDFEDSKPVYLGWIDESIRKLLIIYKLDDKLLGMACRLSESNSNNAHICTLCNHMGKNDEIGFVSPICKTSGKNLDAYKTIGFHVCLDSEKCNERITSTEKLEELLKIVNNIK